jgi:predicted trehalose synthase
VSEARQENLHDILGGRTSAIDATAVPLAYVAGYLLSGRSIWIGSAAALVVTIAIGLWRWRQGGRLTAVLLGALGVAVAAMIALYTGRSVDFFLPRLAGNVVSVLVWVLSIAARWPLLGVVVGIVLGQKTQWRRDPALLRAYQRASWVWVGQYLIRVLVFTPLWLAGQETALGVAQAALTWPLVAACVAISWWVIQRSLPEGHPGLRHPVVPPAAA